MAKKPPTNVTGRDGWIISEALAGCYAAMKLLPEELRPEGDMQDMRDLLFAASKSAEFLLGQTLLTFWNLRADVPPSTGRTNAERLDNLRRIREQVVREAPADDPDTAIFLRHIDNWSASIAQAPRDDDPLATRH